MVDVFVIARQYAVAGLWASMILAAVALVAMLRANRRYRLAHMTPEEIAAQEQERAAWREERALFVAIKQESRDLARKIPEALASQNKMVHHYQQGNKPGLRYRKARKLKFDAVLMTRTEIWFRFDGRKLPFGTSFADLVDPNSHVLQNLQYAVNRPCRFHEDYKFNLFLRVGLHNSLLGIPKHVAWADVVDKLPKERKFSVAIGVNENNKLVYEDVTRWPHVLVTGATGMGKSTCLKQWMATLIKRNSPDSLQFYFVDLKRVELPEFKDIPHTRGHVDRPEQVQAVLQALETELDRRLDMFTGVCTDIIGWNMQRPGQRLPRLFLVVDELATITTDRNLRRDALDSIINLARLGRAAGIHMILCTQTVSKEVLPMDVLANIQGRVTFSLNNISASSLVIGNSLAVGLGHSGRCVYLDGSEYIFCQAPFASSDEVEQVLELARNGGQDDSGEFTADDLFKLILYNLGGVAGWNDVWEACQGVMGQTRIKKVLKQNEFNLNNPTVIEIDGGKYILVPSVFTGKGRTARRLVQVNGVLPETAADLEKLAIGEEWGNGPDLGTNGVGNGGHRLESKSKEQRAKVAEDSDPPSSGLANKSGRGTGGRRG